MRTGDCLNKKIFIRFETPDGISWSDCLECLNTFYDSSNHQTVIRDVSKIRDYSQIVSTYTRIDNRMRMFKTRAAGASHISIGIPTQYSNQTVAINNIKTEDLITVLDNPAYQSAYFAFNHTGIADIKTVDIIPNSTWYARNSATGKMENAITGEVVEADNEDLKFSIWFTVFYFKDTDIYYLVVNPNLLALNEDVSGEHGDTEYLVLTKHDGSFRTSVFSPTVDSESKLIGENIIVTSNDTVTIDTLGNSYIHGFSGNKLDQDQLPKINLLVESPSAYVVNNNIITVTLDKPVTYLSYKWITGTSLDFTVTGPESLIYNLAIIKQ